MARRSILSQLFRQSAGYVLQLNSLVIVEMRICLKCLFGDYFLILNGFAFEMCFVSSFVFWLINLKVFQLFC